MQWFIQNGARAPPIPLKKKQKKNKKNTRHFIKESPELYNPFFKAVTLSYTVCFLSIFCLACGKVNLVALVTTVFDWISSFWNHLTDSATNALNISTLSQCTMLVLFQCPGTVKWCMVQFTRLVLAQTISSTPTQFISVIQVKDYA